MSPGASIVMAVAGVLLSLMASFLLRIRRERVRRTSDAQAMEAGGSLDSKEKQLTGILESIDEVLWTFDFPGWKINYVSPAVERVYGHPAQAFYADRHLWLKCVHAADRQEVIALARSMIETGRQVFEYRIVKPNGEVRWIRYQAHFVRGPSEGSGRVNSVGSDITVQHQLEESLRSRNRILRAIHDCEQVIADSADESTLLQGICDMVAAAGYRLVWTGILASDGSGSIVLGGVAGTPRHYLEYIKDVLDAGERDTATLGEALRTRRPSVVNRFDSDIRLAPWRDEALRCGFQAKIALPLFHETETMGLLNVYAAEKDAFDSGEVALLMGLAQRVAASIQFHRQRSGRQVAENALRLHQRAIAFCANALMIASANAPEYPIVYVNPAFERITGYSAAEVIGRSCRLLQGDDRDQPGIDEIRSALREQRPGNVVLRNYRKDGTLYWNNLHVAPVRDDDGVVRHFVAAQYDITEMKRYEAELRHLAHHDTLTGLPNRALLQDRLHQAIAYSARSAHPVWLLFVDLDRFKFVNDSLGHKAGDEMLRAIAGRLQSSVRQTDTVARLGGDEFVLILQEQADGLQGLGAAGVQRIMDAVAQPLTIDGHEFFPTCSMGVAVYPADGDDVETLMTHADIAMYRAKESGRNNFQFYAASMNAQTMERLHMEGELRHALARDEFVLHYQPQVDLRSGRVVGMEALLRWNHPEFGMVPPNNFIHLAEETGLIVPIGDWVLRSACAQNKAWQNAGMPKLRVAVNLSARQFGQLDLVRSITGILRETGLASHYLEIELTESLVMTDVERAIGTLRELKALGVKLSIDDFGTGYSSLSYLKRFPIDVLKIDRSFVRDITLDPDAAAIVASIISLSHNLKLNVIAEGVETPEQLRYLRQHGCDEMQGFYFSKAVPAEAFERMLRQGKNLSMEFECAAA